MGFTTHRGALGVVALGVVGTLAMTAPAVAASGGHPLMPNAQPRSTGSGFLDDVSAVSSTNVWAVGGTQGVDSRTLIEHWAGAGWSRVASPSRGKFDDLSGVATLSASNVWAVGSSTVGSTIKSLVEHWDGTNWSVQPSPNPAGANESELSGVAAISPTNVWAVGETATAGKPRRNLVEHWDGNTWAIVTSWNPGAGHTASLAEVTALSATNVWAVGRTGKGSEDGGNTLIEHWNGTRWSHLASPNPGHVQDGNELWDVDAVSPGNVWTVGDYGTPGQRRLTLIEHWNGHVWAHVASPNPAGEFDSLNAVSGVSPANVWAVGTTTSGTLIERWRGHAWCRVSSPTSPGSYLSGVTGVSAADAWAVGFDSTGTATRSVIDHWNGTAWTRL